MKKFIISQHANDGIGSAEATLVAGTAVILPYAWINDMPAALPVSYTHLTLPTN